MSELLTIAIDFDGTLAIHDYPEIGDELPLAIKTCKQLQEVGHRLILLTMRDGDELAEAVEWCRKRGLADWFGINENPTQESWTTSRKVYAHMYIDDTALGCPVIPSMNGRRAPVDWVAVRKLLVLSGILPE